MNHDPIELLADILLRGALLLPLCLFLALLLRRGSASLLRRFWRCSLLALLGVSALTFLPPIFTFDVASDLSLTQGRATAPRFATNPTTDIVPGSPVASLEDVLGISRDRTANATPVRASSSASPARAPGFQFSLPITLALLWLGGALVLLGRKLVGTLGVFRLRRAAQPVQDSVWQADLEDLRARCGVRQEIGLRQHLALRSPIVTGMWKPTIILPVDHGEYSSEDRRAVLLHELAHVRNRDASFRWIASLAKMLHWPNPFVWFAERSLRLAEERASDDAVLHGGIAAPNYAALLARLAKGGAPLVGDLGVASGSAMAQPSGLLPRVHAILRARQARRHPGPLSSFALVTTGLALAALIGGSTFLEADPPAGEAPAKSPSAAKANKIQEKLNSIILPDVNFADATLDEALDFIRQRSRELDPAKEGVNIISRVPKPKVSEAGGTPPWEHLLKRKITLNLQEVPLSALLDFISNITSTSYRTTEYALIISLQNWEGLETRNFRLPATVFERELAQRDFGGAADPDPFADGGDPFAEEGNAGAITRGGITAIDWLKVQGVDFGPDTSAFYIKASGTLNIRNTPMELELVERIVDSLNQSPSRRGMRKADAERLALLKKTLQETIIPLVDLADASLEEALEFVRLSTGKKGELNPVQFVYRVDAKKPTVTLKLTNVPVGVVIKHITDLAGSRAVITPYGIEVVRDYQEGGDLRIASFQLSPENLKKIHASMANPPEQFPISETLQQIGMGFPPGSAAFWNSTTGDLIVRQTDTNLSQLASLLEGLAPPGEE